MRTKSNKCFFLLAFALLFTTMAVAQQTTSKEINKIKRSSSYLYAEATMDSEAEAAEVAYELLMKQVDEYIGSKKKLTSADNVLIKDIRSRSEQMSMMRGEMHRVFVYVKKNDIEGVMNTTVVNAASGATITINDNPVLAPVHRAPVQAAPEENPVATTPVVNEVPVNEVPAEEVAVDEVPEASLDEEKQPAASTAVQSDLVGWQQRVITELLECGDITAIRAKLNRLKAQYRVKRFGTPDKCPNSAEACWIIFDNNGNLITILGAGSDSRIDYREMKLSSLSNHRGKNALWFILAK